jgi:hypothetical protein
MIAPPTKTKDDPRETAEFLLKMHGQQEAFAVALQGAVDAQEAGDNYRLSVWREVKRFLKQAELGPSGGTSVDNSA